MHDNISTALITAFEQHYDTRWDDAQLRNERLAWRAAWDAAGAAPAAVAGPASDRFALAAELRLLSRVQDDRFPNFRAILNDAALVLEGVMPAPAGAPDYAGENVAERKAAMRRLFPAAPALEAPAAPGLTDGQLDDESYRVNDEPGYSDAFRAGARFAERVHGLTAAAARAVTGKADWWRGRADEIEVQVARSGSQEAMRCYTDMRTLLQAAAAPQAPAAPSIPQWIDDPHDIEQGQMLNPAWVQAQAAPAAPVEPAPAGSFI